MSPTSVTRQDEQSGPRRPRSRRLVADVGGTYSRFAIVHEDGRIEPVARHRTSEFRGPDEAFAQVLASIPDARVEAIGLAIAAPLRGDAVEMVNAAWSFSIAELAQSTSRPVLAVNDFVAQSFALARLDAAQLRCVGPELAVRRAPKVAIGPGTGLGVGILVPFGDAWEALPSEGGHATAASRTEDESALVSLARQRHEHVSWERLVSGPGLELLHELIALRRGATRARRSAAEITADPADAICAEAMRVLVELLASAASDVALTVNAFGGVHLVGGVLGHLGAAFDARVFRRRFEDKGRYSELLATIPTYHVSDPLAPFRGVDYALDRASRGHVPIAAIAAGDW